MNKYTLKNTAIKLIFLIALVLLVNSTAALAQTEQRMELSYLQLFLRNIDQAPRIEKKLIEMGYHKKFNGIYISNTMLTPKKPKHWLHINQLGSYSNITYATADKISWDRILIELKKQSSPVKFKTGTSEIGYLYRIKGYEIKTYKPLNGINLELNNLYRIVLMKR